MKLKKIFATLLTCVLFITALSSCSLLDYTIEGSWKELDQYVGVCRFNSNGKFEMQAVGYYITGDCKYEEGEMTVVNGKKTLEGTVTIDYKEITYTNDKGDKVTEPFNYTYVTTETEIVEKEVGNAFNPDKVTVEKVEVTKETEHKGKLAKPLTGKYVISEQNTSAESLTILFDDKIEVVNEDGSKTTVDLKDTKWKFERSYDKI